MAVYVNKAEDVNFTRRLRWAVAHDPTGTAVSSSPYAARHFAEAKGDNLRSFPRGWQSGKDTGPGEGKPLSDNDLEHERHFAKPQKLAKRHSPKRICAFDEDA
jgi:hypothetical protein